MSANLTYAAYAVVAAGLVVTEVVCVLNRSGGLGQLLRRVVGTRLGTFVFLLGWAWLGWHLFARGHAGFLH